ncbi:small multi-drug export protein [Candidatus Poribacteria bacterium]|nr:small multi-drug export protein [Candidatus Poribacteria bacterium]
MTPIFELRGAIPVAAIFSVNIAIWKVFLIAVIGNMIPVLPILLFLEPMSNFLSKHSKIFNRFFEWLFKRTKRKIGTNIEKYGALGLIVFVAIPLPATGAWSGCIAAFLFGIRLRYAFPSILAGVILAGIVVTIVTYGASSIFRLF